MSEETPTAKESYGSKLRAMREDLRRIVSVMNKDRSYDVAQKAQTALVAIAALEDEIDSQMGCPNDVKWDWEPEAEE